MYIFWTFTKNKELLFSASIRRAGHVAGRGKDVAISTVQRFTMHLSQFFEANVLGDETHSVLKWMFGFAVRKSPGFVLLIIDDVSDGLMLLHETTQVTYLPIPPCKLARGAPLVHMARCSYR